VLLLTSTLNLFAQRQRYQGEIIVTVCGITGEDKKWTVTAEALSSIRWDEVDEQCYITTGYCSASVSADGNDGVPRSGFRCPYGHLGGDEDLAFSEYRFSWDLPAPHSDPDPIDIDLRDADWTNNYSSPYDIWIRYNITDSKYEVRIGTGPYSELTDDTIWDILDEAPPNKEAFQPTEPKNLTCTNPNEKGEHPHFTWTSPDWPGARDLTVSYGIFRNDDEVDNDITSESWTDEDVGIHPQGSSLIYYVRAYLSNSPDSDPSNSVSINGYVSKKCFGDDNNLNDKNLSSKNSTTSLSISPNPFNPIIQIFYYLPKESYVQLDIYNIAGQKIEELVNLFQYPGEYSINFNGNALVGGIYLVRFQYNNQLIMKKILLVK